MNNLADLLRLAVDNGFDCFGYANKDGFKISTTDSPMIAKGKVAVRFHMKKKAKYSKDGELVSMPPKDCYTEYSLTDLLFSPESNFMQSLFPGGETRLYGAPIKNYIFHQYQCLPLPSDDARIKYLVGAIRSKLGEKKESE